MRILSTIILAAGCATLAFADNPRHGRRLTIAQAVEMVGAAHPAMRAALQSEDAARAAVQASKAYDNPTLDLMYNVRNPNNRRWFDGGQGGELDVSAQQPIAIGGQHSERVRRERAAAAAAHHQTSDIFRRLTAEVSAQLVKLYYLQKRTDVYDRELKSLEAMRQTYREQADKGNISQMELQRLETMIFGLKKERQDLMAEASDLRHDILFMTGSATADGGDDGDFIPVIDEAAMHSAIAALPPLPTLAAMAAEGRPDLQAAAAELKACRHEVKLQKAQALPSLSLKGEYDKNGNIGHNYFGVGVGLSLPLWNHNRGNIQAAKISLQQTELQRQTALRQAQTDIAKTYSRLLGLRRLAAEGVSEVQTNEMLENASKQRLSRNISMVEFIDLYDNYKATALGLIDTQELLAQAAVELNCRVGREIVRM